MRKKPSPIYTGGRGIIPFGWYGGKFSHLKWLLPLLPACHHYCEPYAGSGAVLLNRAPSPVETYNDIDGEVVNFFRVLRDHSGEFTRLAALTPFSREEFFYSLTPKGNDIERARQFFVRAIQVRGGLVQAASLGRWNNGKRRSCHGVALAVSRWLGHIEGLPEIAERLLRVQIENRPAFEVIQIYDTPDTLFYVDPPYPLESRSGGRAYKFEMSEADHEELAGGLKKVKGMAAISGYRCGLMDRLYQGWHRVDGPAYICHICHSAKTPRQESLWMNYSADEK